MIRHRLRRLSNHLKALSEKDPFSFDMNTFGHETEDASCGTAACIAGHAAILCGTNVIVEPAVHSIAQEWLGLNDEQADDLFMPSTPLASRKSPWAANALEASRVVDHLIATGEVDWTKAFP